MQYIVEIALIIVGGLLLTRGFKTHHEVNRYEFENRSGGGVVQFKSYEDSLRHEAKANRSKMSLQVGFLLVLAGVIALGVSIANA